MIAYVDASVLLRLVLAQPDSLAERSTVERGVASALVDTKTLRTLDRVRLRARLSDVDFAARRAKARELLTSLEIVDVDSAVLDRAAQPVPTELGTLDAIHLATALLWRDATRVHLTLATHDPALGVAAVAHGLPVVGVGSGHAG